MDFFLSDSVIHNPTGSLVVSGSDPASAEVETVSL